MRAEEIKGLMEAYSKINETPEVSEEVVEQETEQLDEDLIGDVISNRGKIKSAVTKATTATNRAATATNKALGSATSDTAKQVQSGVKQTAKDVAKGYQYGGSTGAAAALGANIVRGIATSGKPAKPAAKPKVGNIPTKEGTGKGSPTDKTPPKPPAAPAPTAAPKPTASGVVLAKQGGVEGKLDKATGKFTAGTFTDKEKARYTQRAPKTNTPAATTTPAKPTPSSTPAAKPATPQRSFNPLMQKTFGYQTGNAPDQIAKASAGVSKEKSDAAFAKTKEDIKTKLKPSADLKMSTDIFDLVKGHLLDEGYADSEEGAMVIMVNMSEEWRKSILEAHGVELDEAQEAREKPEEHEEKEEKENEKKYGHVRGERTPMPPRGDKRREEFEKWYAKQMSR